MTALVVLAVLCTASSQIVQALAARKLSENGSLSDMLLHPLVILAYALLGGGLILWLIALQSVELSQTYPLFACGFVITMLFARFGFGEHIGLRGWMGVGFIVAGSALCSLTEPFLW